MNIFKKIFKGKSKDKKIEKSREKKTNECWYNNAHENGEAVRNSRPIESGGSGNGYEASLTEAAVRK